MLMPGIAIAKVDTKLDIHIHGIAKSANANSGASGCIVMGKFVPAIRPDDFKTEIPLNSPSMRRKRRLDAYQIGQHGAFYGGFNSRLVFIDDKAAGQRDRSR